MCNIQMMKMLRFIVVFLGIFTVLFEVCHSVEITSFSVPAVHIIKDPRNPELLVLDCGYNLPQDETGFVLKWLINNVNIYQFIPSKGATALSYMKNRVDVNYTVSDDPNQKHRALAITRPFYNMTGAFTCSVQTFQTRDTRTADLKIIVPESDFQLEKTLEGNELLIECSALNIYPKPNLSISLGDNQPLNLTERTKADDVDGLYDSFVVATINTEGVETETSISCDLSIPGTDYTKRKATVYYGVPTTTTTTTTTIAPPPLIDDDMENSSEPSRLEAAITDVGSSSPTIKSSIIFTIIFCILSTLL